MSLTEARQKAGLTREKLAYRINVAVATLGRWEKGISKVPSDALPRLQAELGLSDTEVLNIIKQLQKESA